MLLRERKLNRLPGYDYSKKGWYFVTIDCFKMYPWFGKINVGTGHCPVRTSNRIGHCPVRTIMQLNNCGLVAEKYWKNISKIYKDVVLDEFIIMPNHVHGIIRIVGTGHWPVPTDNNNQYGKLSKIINGYKNMVTKKIRNNLKFKNFQWQRSFYDEIIRGEKSLQNIRKYIIENPRNFLKSK